MKNWNENELRLLSREPDPEPAPTPDPAAAPEMDAAESCWDPWLLALARIEANETRAN
ncbi:MAG TPA: hypothetical protein VII78_12815 [Myxococcota bacterium]|jgi:hypothetical protein